MRGRRGLFSLFTSLPDHPEDQPGLEGFESRRRRRHSSGDRETWTRKVEYFFASLGYAVGLGNIWRFPYLCYRNGGGAFLIPYFLSLFVVGFPIMYMEMAFGQFASLGTITIWRICPLFKGAFLIPYILALLVVGFPIMYMEMAFGQFASIGTITIWRVSPIFKGIGYAIVVVLLLVNTYYNVLIAYALFFLFSSITDELPWSNCDNKWNTKYCIATKFDPNKYHNGTFSSNGNGDNDTVTEAVNATLQKLLKTPTEEFFERHLLRQTDGIDDLGEVQWPLIVCLCVSWAVCYMCLFKGIKSMGKAVIFTTIFSYIILTVLLIRGVTLPGAANGIVYYLKPDFKRLKELSVWGEASAQAFASLTLGGGGWITLSSYNKFNNRCNRDAILVGLGNAATSLYSGFVIFSVLGYMAYIKGVDIADVTAKGPGLAFVAYPEGLALIPGAPFWAICFFFMMFTVGLDSLFGQVETIAAGIIDEYPDLLRPHRKIFTLCLCGFMFCLGIPLVTQGGIYIVTLMDWYVLLFSFSIISFFEVMVIMYVYGYLRFSNDIELMIGNKPSMYFTITWRFLTPFGLVLVIAFLFSNYVPGYYGDYNFPAHAESIGWLLALGPCLLIPIVAVYKFFRKVPCGDICRLCTDSEARENAIERLLRPSMEWGPAQPEVRRKYSYDPKKGSVADDERLANIRAGIDLGDDDVFGGGDGVKLTSVKHVDEKNEKDKLVHFEEDNADKEKSDDKPEESQELVEKKNEEDTKA